MPGARSYEEQREQLAVVYGRTMPADLHELLGYRVAPPGSLVASAPVFADRTAQHEAAHAVVAVALGIRFTAVRLTDDLGAEDGFAGQLVLQPLPFRDADGPRDDAKLQNLIAVCLAGPEWDSQNGGLNAPASESTDFLSAWAYSGRLITRIFADHAWRVTCLRWAAYRARAVLELDVPAVVAVSAELLDHGELSEAEIRRLVRAARRGP